MRSVTIMKKSSSARNTHKNIVSCSNDERFLAACDRIIHTEHIENGIGTLSEKTVHSVLKYYLEPDTSFHEVKTGRYVADIRTPDGIYEIQTRQFNKLRNKLEAFPARILRDGGLPHTAHKVSTLD